MSITFSGINPFISGKQVKKAQQPQHNSTNSVAKTSHSLSFGQERKVIDNYNKTFVAYQTPNSPKFQLMTGKFNPSGIIRDEKRGLRIIFLSGSKIEGKNFKYVMPGGCMLPGQEGNRLSFCGNNPAFGKGSTLGLVYHNLEPKTHRSFQLFQQDGIQNQVEKGDYHNETKGNEVTFAIAAGGFGTRFLNISGKNENKTSSLFPTRPSFRVMGCALTMASMTGAFETPANFKFFSQTGQLTEGENVIRINKELDANKKPRNLEDGGGIAEALAKGHLPSDKDMIISGADCFTNADLTRTYHKMNELKDAAIIIPYYPEPKERTINTFGLISAKEDEKGNLVIDEFIEKPKPSTDFSKLTNAEARGTDKYMINPGMYVLSKEAVQLLKEKGENNEAVGLGGKFIPELVKKCQNGEIRNAEGKPMKVYTFPLEAKGGRLAIWDDVGSAEAYATRIRDVAYETISKGTGKENKYYGMPEFVLQDFANAVDVHSGVICGKNEKAKFEDFKKEYNISEDGIRGNVLVLPMETT